MILWSATLRLLEILSTIGGFLLDYIIVLIAMDNNNFISCLLNLNQLFTNLH